MFNNLFEELAIKGTIDKNNKKNLMRKYYICVIETERNTNEAYIGRSYSFENNLDEVTLEDKWFNTVVGLDWLERKLERTFEDGSHDFMEATIYIEKDEDW